MDSALREVIVTGASAIAAVAVPYALVLGRTMINQYIKNAAGQRFANGALAAAGRAYTVVMTARQANPTAPLGPLIESAVAKEAGGMLTEYSDAGANITQATTRVTGELGKLLAADPTVGVSAPVAPPV